MTPGSIMFGLIALFLGLGLIAGTREYLARPSSMGAASIVGVLPFAVVALILAINEA